MNRGWTIKEREDLIEMARQSFKSDTPLKAVFANFAEMTNRKRDSVRNFYYSVLAEAELRGEKIRGIKKIGIEVFSYEEIKSFMTFILEECRDGCSVRGAIEKMSNDPRKKLRYQNKYRNLVKSHDGIIDEIIQSQKKNGKYFNPFTKQVIVIENEKFASKTPLNEKLNSLRMANKIVKKAN